MFLRLFIILSISIFFSQANELRGLKKELNKIKQDVLILKKTNDYFNKFSFKSDKIMGFREGYIQSIYEFIENKAGDSLDFVNSKYDILKDIKYINPNNLYFIYGKRLNQKNKNFVHLLVGYKIKEEFLVLDNIDKDILLLSEKQNFRPIVAYNKITRDKITLNIENFVQELEEMSQEDLTF